MGLALLIALAITPSVGVAAEGWHLRLPPRDRRGRTELQTPLSRWVSVAAFDTFAQCRAERERRLGELRAMLKRLLKPDPTRAAILIPDSPHPPWKREYYRLWGDIGRLSVGRCVPAAGGRLAR